MWLYNWEKAFKDSEKLNIPEVSRDLPIDDFLDTVATVSPGFI